MVCTELLELYREQVWMPGKWTVTCLCHTPHHITCIAHASHCFPCPLPKRTAPNPHWASRETSHFFRETLAKIQSIKMTHNTLLKSDVTSRDHVVRCGSQECGSRFVNFACQFHWRWHSFRITLKSTTFLFMRSSNVWTTKPWQRS